MQEKNTEELKNELEMVSTLCVDCGNLQSHFFKEFECECGCKEYVKVNLDVLDQKERKIFLITGPTGAGKNWLTKKLEDVNFENVPSLTTRSPREGEIPGIDYYFISTSFFEKLENENRLCEKIVFGNDSYGVGKEILLNKLWKDTKNLIFIVEPNGLEQMVKWFNKNIEMLKLLNIEISSIFLDIPRIERFTNLLNDAKLLVDGDELLLLGLSKITNPEKFDLPPAATDEQIGFSNNQIALANSVIRKVEKILDRLVRNGDNMDKEYYQTIEELTPIFRLLNKNGVQCYKHILRTKEEMNNFVLDNKLMFSGVQNILLDIQKVEDKELLSKIKAMVEEQLEKGK